MSDIIQASEFGTRIDTASHCAIGPNDPTVKLIISKPSAAPHRDEMSIAAIVVGLLIGAARLGS
jgi:hypothetical protein